MEKELRDLLKKKGHSASLVDISIDGHVTLLSDIADIQRDPVTDRLLHVDFHEVSQTEKMTTAVPLEFFGESVGVKNGGGVLDIARHEINVKCLPADLPSSIRIDVSALDIGNVIHLGDVQVPAGVELVGDHVAPVVSCSSAAVNAESEPSAEAVSKEQSSKSDAAKVA
jgi:large subunit ribosomal protein L25